MVLDPARSAPRPATTRRRRKPTLLGRALQVGRTLAGALLRSLWTGRGRPSRRQYAEALATAFINLGSAYLKLGQILASSPGVVGEETAEAFRRCLDLGAPVPEADVRAALEQAAGRPLSDIYQAVAKTAIGRASIAVVHRAVTADGTEVAIKIRRPYIELLVSLDLRILRAVQRLGSLLRRSATTEVDELLDDFERTVLAELDFDAERRATERARARLAAAGLELVVPATYPRLSDENVLVMDYLRGRPIDDAAWIARLGVDAGTLVDAVIRTWLVSSVGSSEFHGDCHAGNLLVLTDGRVALIDWGIVGRLSPRATQLCRSLLEGSLGVDAAWEQVATIFQNQYGDRLTSGFGVSAEELSGVLRDLLGPLLTAPFGNRSLADFMDQVRLAEPDGPAKSTPPPPDAEEDFEQGFFLWLKQLVFFERYARLHQRFRSIASYAAEVLADRTDLQPGPTDASRVSGLHHAGLVVRELGRTIGTLNQLGFSVSTPTVPALPGPQGERRAFGTANCHADFPDGTFLEAMTVVGEGEAVPRAARLVPLQVPRRAVPHLRELINGVLDRLQRRLDLFDGVHVLVFETAEPYAESRRLSDIGVGHSGVTSATRREPGGAAEPVYVVEIDDPREPTPEGRLALAGPRPARAPVHRNGAQGLAEVILCAAENELAGTIERYGSLLGVTPRATARGHELCFDRSKLLITTASSFAEELPGEQPPTLPAFAAVTVTVDDLARTTEFLVAQGLAPRRSGQGEVFVPAAQGPGTTIIFRAATP